MGKEDDLPWKYFTTAGSIVITFITAAHLTLLTIPDLFILLRRPQKYPNVCLKLFPATH